MPGLDPYAYNETMRMFGEIDRTSLYGRDGSRPVRFVHS